MRYYSIMRPVMPGSYPKKAAAQEIENFDEKTFCEEIGREAWGLHRLLGGAYRERGCRL